MTTQKPSLHDRFMSLTPSPAKLQKGDTITFNALLEDSLLTCTGSDENGKYFTLTLDEENVFSFRSYSERRILLPLTLKTEHGTLKAYPKPKEKNDEISLFIWKAFAKWLEGIESAGASREAK